MESDWRSVRLEDCMEAIIDYRGKTPNKVSHGVPLITAKIVKNGVIETPTEFVAETEYDDWMRRGLPHAGDVLLTTEAPLGEVAQLEHGRVALAQRIILLRGKPGELDNSFLKFLLQSHNVRAQLTSRSSGTTVSGIKQSELRKVLFLLPSYTEQVAIAGILKVLTDGIQLKQAVNQTLESFAQAIFKSWFVDFDPVRAKAEGREPEGMDSVTAALFPAEFTISKEGIFPAGWSLQRLPEFLFINPLRSLSKSVPAPYLEMANAPTSGSRPVAWVRRMPISGCRFRNGDTLLAKITPCLENGKTAFIDFLNKGDTGWGSTEFIVLTPRPPIPAAFAYLLARQTDFRAFAIQSMSGTSGRQRIQIDQLENFRFPIADDLIYQAFKEIVEPIFALIKLNDDQAKTLAELRDTLLPRLISGKLRVPEAEKLVKAVL